MKHSVLRVLLLPDKFKGSLGAEEVVAAIRYGLHSAFPLADVHAVAISDGGEGFLQAISKQTDCDTISVRTVDPLGRKIAADYLRDAPHKTAYIELAKASGLELLSGIERDVLNTSTYGTGLQIKDAIAKGAKHIYVGLGGSATNDGGIGIAAALGYEFQDAKGKQLAPIGKNLIRIRDIGKVKDAICFEDVSIFAVNDVDNTLYGAKGAAYTYGKQKGATDTEIETLDQGLKRLSQVVQEKRNMNVAQLSGAGAAGGAAYGLKVFLAAELIPGTDFLFQMTKLTKVLTTEKFDYIITGEGKLDKQTANGKLIKGVVGLGSKFKVPVIAVCGKSELGEERYKAMGLYDVIQIHKESRSLDYSMQHAAELIAKEIATYFRRILNKC